MELNEPDFLIRENTYGKALEKLQEYITEVFTEDNDAEAVVVVDKDSKIQGFVEYNKDQAQKLELLHFSAPCSRVITRQDFQMLKEKDRKAGNNSCPECGNDDFQQGQGAKICSNCGTVQ